MKQTTYALLEDYMCNCMADSAHDKEHVYRVLYSALQIAREEEHVDYDVLIAACLLHDIGRREQFDNSALCHAQVGAEKAVHFLREHGFEEDFIQKVCHCIRTHRFRKATPPETVEAKILFDADKLDATGAIGVARTLMYKADMEEPLYRLLPDGSISDGTEDIGSSFFREYKFKLEKLYDRFYTHAGSRMAQSRRQIAAAYYEALYREVSDGYDQGRAALERCLEEWRA